MGDEKVNHINYFANTYKNNVGNKNQNPKNNKFLGIMEGYVLGNMERGTYIPYKNYKPKKINAYSEQQKMLLRIQELDFIINDLNLYLDVYPNDMKCYEIFKKYFQKFILQY